MTSAANGLAPAAHDDEMPSPRSKASKVVSYAQVSENISPLIPGERKDLDNDDDEFSVDRSKQHRASSARRLSGRVTESLSGAPLVESRTSESGPRGDAAVEDHFRHRQYPNFLEQVTAWLEEEKAKSRARRAERHAPNLDGTSLPKGEKHAQLRRNTRRSSNASDSTLALGKLEKIIEKALALTPAPRLSSRKNSHRPHKTSSHHKLRHYPTSVSSDTDFQDGDTLVPSCEAWLDNTRTLSCSNSTADVSDTLDPNRPNAKDFEVWRAFKFETVRLIHTLRVKGWRRVPLDCSSDICIEKLSGALTNSVYVISPPKNLSDAQQTTDNGVPMPRKPPPKLLLRIYGPNVSHLINRDSELSILRRLARKNIGPRLLGTFTNGRFEEYFHARPLTPQDLRNPETSKQIAKRMRELHDGIALEEQEVMSGPFVWQNWDKWVARCEKIMEWFDRHSLERKEMSNTELSGLPRPLLVCGVEWEKFREAVERYRKWLDLKFGGQDQICQRLVFSHNDTQYGNILRHIPQGDSPLLLPANEHKQLVVIDFEYANANVPGLEFANHFTEWCYNYHDEHAPYALNHWAYPSPLEQNCFLRSYICHHPQFGLPPSATNTPRFKPASEEGAHEMGGATSVPSSVNLGPSCLSPRAPSLPPAMLGTSGSDFVSDPGGPPRHFSHVSNGAGATDWHNMERAADEAIEEEVQRLMHETRLWRAANSAQWVAWGIMQANLPKDLAREIDCSRGDELELKQTEVLPSNQLSVDPEEALIQGQPRDTVDKRLEIVEELEEKPEEETEGDAEDFDYLAYAHERALFFWGDVLQEGVVAEEELPEELRARVKKVEY